MGGDALPAFRAGDFGELLRGGGFVFQEVKGRFQLHRVAGEEIGLRVEADADWREPMGDVLRRRLEMAFRRPDSPVIAGMGRGHLQRLADAAEDFFFLAVHRGAFFCDARRGFLPARDR